MDLARLVNLSEVIGSSSVKTGTFKQAVVTLDYSRRRSSTTTAQPREWS